MIPPPKQGGRGSRAPALTYVVTSGGAVVHAWSHLNVAFCGVVLSGFRTSGGFFVEQREPCHTDLKLLRSPTAWCTQRITAVLLEIFRPFSMDIEIHCLFLDVHLFRFESFYVNFRSMASFTNLPYLLSTDHQSTFLPRSRRIP